MGSSCGLKDVTRLAGTRYTPNMPTWLWGAMPTSKGRRGERRGGKGVGGKGVTANDKQV
jgi:hypothetical protein